MPLKAIIFDVDGTMAETEEAHRAAFNQAFAEAGRDWHWNTDLYRSLLSVTGGQRRIRHFLNMIGENAAPAAIAALHARKNELYGERVASGEVALRPGVARLVEEARGAGIKLAIATTTSRSNLEALLAHLFASGATSWFAAIVAGEDVTMKKPHPEVYTRALAMLDLPPHEVVAIEDSRNGLLAATACGIPTVVTPSLYSAGEDFSAAAMVCHDLDRLPVDLAALATF